MQAKCRNGKEGQGVYPGVGGALLLPLFCWQCLCVMCAREKERRLKGLCLLFYELGCPLGFSEAVHCLQCQCLICYPNSGSHYRSR